MTSPAPHDSVFKTATRLTRRAFAYLYWERYARVMSVAAIAIALFLIGSFTGVWERIGDPWRGLSLLAFIGLSIKAALAVRHLKRPNTSEARRRVESDSGQSHRPLDTLYDHPATQTDGWPAHYAAALKNVTRLSPPRLRPTLAPHDPYRLRFIVPAFLGLAFIIGYGDNFERVRRALSPTWQYAMSPSDLQFEAWIDPPDYTGRPPVYFKTKTDIDVPAGSELVARITGSRHAPRLKIMTDNGNRYLKLKRLGPKSFEARTTLHRPAHARWRVGQSIKKWTLNVIDDAAPTVTFDEPPTADKRDRLAFTASYSDDYGVEGLELHVQTLTDAPDISETDIITLPLPSVSVKHADKRQSALDLTKHKWAGEKVFGKLVAKDGLGQSAETEPVYFTIPDKIFIEPLAKAVAENRSLVLRGDAAYAPPPKLTRKAWRNQPYFDTYEPEFRLNRAPETVQRAAVLLEAITDEPDSLFTDVAVFMGLKNVLGRIRYADEQADLSGIGEDLWSIALRAEFGVLGTALQEMQEAEQNLRDGMARRAPQREIDTLFERYDTAVERYMEELKSKAMEDGNMADASSGGGESRNTDQIEELLKAIEEANRMGDVDGARKALAQLAELLENMQIQMAQGGSGGSGEGERQQMSEEMRKSLEEMADLLGEQRQLNDETEQAELRKRLEELSNGPDGDSGQGSSGSEDSDSGEAARLSPQELAERQKTLEDLARNLAENGPKLGQEDDDTNTSTEGMGALSDDANEALSDALRAMEDSRNALMGDALGDATEAQREAIAALRRAGKALSDLAEGQQGEDGETNSAESNPLGQLQDGANDDEFDADIDTRDNATRSRELLEELRRRASEQDREQIEREYLERLLKRF